jgi:hypothetical protein
VFNFVPFVGVPAGVVDAYVKKDVFPWLLHQRLARQRRRRACRDAAAARRSRARSHQDSSRSNQPHGRRHVPQRHRAAAAPSAARLPRWHGQHRLASAAFSASSSDTMIAVNLAAQLLVASIYSHAARPARRISVPARFQRSRIQVPGGSKVAS